ncbi:MAG TPA: MATE family efflux transporter [Dongiaceae bacterium]|jgi:MATE family multidrug resistance protein|nr:MATE family efflux transporter [Dongiaceae bacterium]
MSPSLTLTQHIQRTFTLALPVMLARAGLVVMVAVDTILVGRASSHELAFFAISAAPQIIMIAVSVGLMVGTVVLTAQADGAGRQQECGRFWRLAMLLSIGIGLLFSAILVRGDLVLHALGEGDDIAEGGGKVMQMWAIGMPAAVLYGATSTFLEGISRPRTGMIVSLGANLVNLPLAWALIFGHFGLPAMGAMGAALATSISRWLMFAAMAGYVLRMPDRERFGIYAPLTGYYHLIGKMLVLGLPVGFAVTCETTAFSGATIIAGWLGETPLAAYQLSINVTSFFYMLTLGLGTAAAVRVGNAVGRDDQPGIRQAGWIAVAMIAVAMFVIGIAIHFLRAGIAGVYSVDAAVIEAALPALTVISILVIFDGVQGVLMGALRGTGDVLFPMAGYLIAFWGCALPLCYYWGYRQAAGAVGIVEGLTAGLVVICSLLGGRFYIVARRRVRAV